MFGGGSTPPAEGSLPSLNSVAGQARDFVGQSSTGRGLLDRGQAMAERLGSVGMAALTSQIPGGSLFLKPVLEQAKGFLKADLPGGFQLGKQADVVQLQHMDGYQVQSIPDGANLILMQESECFHCCCCWAGRGPILHVVDGSDLVNGADMLSFHAHRRCCFASPEIDVVLPSGEVVAGADEHTCCCIGADTDTQVRGDPSYHVRGGWCFGCLSEHDIEEDVGNGRRRVGSIVHTRGRIRIDFPEDARASDKAALLAAAMLFELRWK